MKGNAFNLSSHPEQQELSRFSFKMSIFWRRWSLNVNLWRQKPLFWYL